jgi:DNA-binding transcriptional MocR family regulator
MARFASMPGAIPMHGGLPPADAFPFSSLTFALAPPAAGGVDAAAAATTTTPPASSEEDDADADEPAVEATIVPSSAANRGGPPHHHHHKVVVVAAATPSPDHHPPKDHRHPHHPPRQGPPVVVAVAASAATGAGQRRLCRCNAAAASSTLSPTLVIDNPLVVASAQQYNIGNYGQAGLRAWAARATAELQRPAPIAGSDAWLLSRRRRRQATTDPSSAPLLPPPPPPAPPGNPRAAVASTLHRGGRDLALTAGSTAALDAALRALLSRGDSLLAEQFTYSHALEALMAPHGYRLVPVEMDRDQGICPRALDAAAEREFRLRGRAPKVLYTIPVGQNPTGCVAGRQRLREVYAVARKWGMVVIEDDAYCWLRLHDDGGLGDQDQEQEEEEGREVGNGHRHQHHHPDDDPNNAATPAPLLPRPGLLSLDEDGRVLRLDTFAKLLAPGLRLGWATGPARLLRVVAEATMAATVGPPALSQAVAAGLLQRWGCCCCVFEDEDEDVEEEEDLEEEEEQQRQQGGVVGGSGGKKKQKQQQQQPHPSAIGPGFRHYLSTLQRRYAVQADLAARCAERHLAGVADFVQPRAGMFLWVRLLPAAAAGGGEGGGGEATAALVVDGDSVVSRAGDLGVAVVPGRIFAVESYVRDDQEDGGGEAQRCSRCVGGSSNGGGAAAAKAAAASASASATPRAPCPYLRVSFVNTPAHLMDEGLRRLRQAIDEELAEMVAARRGA